MKIAVLGTGSAGRTVAPALARLGHEVVVGTRDPDATRNRGDWPEDLPLQEYGVVADGADLVVNATNGMGSLSALAAVGSEQLAGKVLLDLANPLASPQGSLRPWQSRTPTRSRSRSSAPSPRPGSSRH